MKLSIQRNRVFLAAITALFILSSGLTDAMAANGIYVTPQQFGAKADGKADDTKAIAKAIQKACETNGVVYFPSGTYRTDEIELPAQVTLKCEPSWSYRTLGRVVIIPAREDQRCILDLSLATGATIYGLCFDGRNIGNDMHGIATCDHKRDRNREHTFRIDNCRITNFSGDGLHMVDFWAFTLRNSMSNHNGGDGCYLEGCDCWINDNIFSSNGKAGIGGDTWNSAVTAIGNRIEWNRQCGVRLCASIRFALVGNYIDRSFGPAIILDKGPNYHERIGREHTVLPCCITICGNNIVRSARNSEKGSDLDCQILLRNAAGVTITGNTFNVWKDDSSGGRATPSYGIVIENCSDCVITGNEMMAGAAVQLFLNKGGNGENVIIADNAGTALPEKARESHDPFTPAHYLLEGGIPWYVEHLKGEENNR